MIPILKYLGAGTPVIYALAVYSLFHFLDKRASAQAKNAITNWCRGKHYDDGDAARAILEIFDRIYSSPLNTWTALIRSAIISTLITVLVVIEFVPVVFWFSAHSLAIALQYVNYLINNVLSDFLSLFLVRFWLSIPGRRPLIALFIGALLGFSFVFLIYIIIDVARFSMMTRSFHLIYFLEDVYNWKDFMTRPGGFNKYFVMSAFLVHCWLLLLGLSMIVVRSLNPFRAVVLHVQWFLKRGSDHPFQAIGYVASGITFLVMLAVKLM